MLDINVTGEFIWFNNVDSGTSGNFNGKEAIDGDGVPISEDFFEELFSISGKVFSSEKKCPQRQLSP